ncbi:hypothetical protein [Aeromicrobium sp. UC242_57]|uniref:FAD binding domain-containing protein n=1 Tax=Aeromicrobium sp. UC242_57 TaxID=3374624 RepID=UPI00379616DC
MTQVRTYAAGGDTVLERPNPYLMTSWTAIYRSLLASLGRSHYHVGHELTSIEPGPHGVSLGFATGDMVQADLVIGADGIASAARRLLGAETTRTYSGYVGWRGTVDPDLLDPSAAARLRAAISFGTMPGGHIVAYPIPKNDGSDDVMLNFVWYRDVGAGNELDQP